MALLHCSFDRAVHDGLVTKIVARGEAFYDDRFRLQSDDDLLSQLLDWHLDTACSLHDTKNSLKWGVGSHVDESGLKEIHIVFESLRNSFSLLAARMRGWLMKK